MVPAAFVSLAELPLTPNGKIDRRRLPAPDWGALASRAAYEPPRTPVEELLGNIWSQLLGVERVGVNDNFFELGGHSLLATRLLARVLAASGAELSLRGLFEGPTVRRMARLLEEALAGGVVEAPPPIERVERGAGERAELSYAQRRLWFLDQLSQGSAAYNMSAALWMEGTLHLPVLEETFTEITRRHEVFRSTFEVDGDEPVQLTHPAEWFGITSLDLSDAAEPEREAMRLAQEEAERPFDLGRGPLLRATLLRLGAEKHVLLLTMHHIVSDGWSVGVLIKEMAALYKAYLSEQPALLPELPIQYADFALWQRRWLTGDVLERQLSYWQRQLRAAPPLLELPTDRPRMAVQSQAGARETFEFSPGLLQSLNALSRREGVTVFMTVLAAFKTQLWRYTKQDDLVVGTPISGRTHAEIENLIGFFANTLVLRTDLSGDPTF
jgi:hypothetical protein